MKGNGIYNQIKEAQIEDSRMLSTSLNKEIYVKWLKDIYSGNNGSKERLMMFTLYRRSIKQFFCKHDFKLVEDALCSKCKITLWQHAAHVSVRKSRIEKIKNFFKLSK